MDIKACGYHKNYTFSRSLSNFKCILLVMRGETLSIFDGGVKGQGQILHFVINLMGTIQATVLAKSLSTFSCKLLMMRED